MKDLKEEKSKFIINCLDLFVQCAGNIVILPNGEELTIFEQPLIGFGSAEDELFTRYKDPKIIGPMFWTPKEWLQEAKSVVVFFFPFTESVRKSNRENGADPSVHWLYGRIEGQQYLNEYMGKVKHLLENRGIKACVPSSDKRFTVQMYSVGSEEKPELKAESRWSERHAAYVCGLGTFGLSRGMITQKGMAGRFASIIVDTVLSPDERPYIGVFDYCVKCGACARRCPTGAITVEYGKNNAQCSRYVDKMEERYAPRYGCGKCQTGVPCERGIPSRQK